MSYLTGEGVVPGLRLVVGSWSVRDRRVEDVPCTSQAETWAADDETASVAKSNANSGVNNCELGILANVKLPATSEYPTLCSKYYIYELLWNSRFELNDEWRKWVAVAFCPVAFCPCGLLSCGLLSCSLMSVAFCPCGLLSGSRSTCVTNGRTDLDVQ